MAFPFRTSRRLLGTYNILKKELVLFRDAFGGIKDDGNPTSLPGEIEYSWSSFFNNFANAFFLV